MVWDVAVIGSGPAGCAVAMDCAKAGLRTAIFTLTSGRRNFAITETLPATAREALEGLGVAPGREGVNENFGLRPHYAMSSAWGSDELTTRHSISNPAGHGWFVDRAAFDEALIREAVMVAPMTEARLITASRENDCWVLGLKPGQESEPVVVKASVVVDATGRASDFARRIGHRRIAFDNLISASTHAAPIQTAAGEAMVEAACDGWWFSAPALPATRRGELSVSWFTEGRLLRGADRSAAALETRLRETTHTAGRTSSLPPGALEWRSARTDCLEVFGGDGWIAVGDAAVACDPLGSQGLVRALESAEKAAELIAHDRMRGAETISAYEEFQTRYLQRFLRHRHYFYAMERRWPDAPFWRRLDRQHVKVADL